MLGGKHGWPGFWRGRAERASPHYKPGPSGPIAFFRRPPFSDRQVGIRAGRSWPAGEAGFIEAPRESFGAAGQAASRALWRKRFPVSSLRLAGVHVGACRAASARARNAFPGRCRPRPVPFSGQAAFLAYAPNQAGVPRWRCGLVCEGGPTTDWLSRRRKRCPLAGAGSRFPGEDAQILPIMWTVPACRVRQPGRARLR